MEDLSPFTRRFVALGLLVLLVLGVTNFVVMPLANALPTSLGRLGDARFERARSEAIVGRSMPPPAEPLKPGLTIAAVDRVEAGQRIAALLRDQATVAKLSVTRLEPGATAGLLSSQAAVDVDVAGSEAGIVAFVNRVETGSPLIRLHAWRLSIDDQHVLRLTGRALAVWRTR